jgi:hypothetical protein
MSKTLKLRSSTAQTSNNNSDNMETVAALSATGLPAYLIEAGKKVTDKLEALVESMLDAEEQVDVGPIAVGVTAHVTMNGSLDKLPRRGSTQEESNDPDKYPLTSKQGKKRKNAKASARGQAPKFGYRLKEFVAMETKLGRTLSARIAEVTKLRKEKMTEDKEVETKNTLDYLSTRYRRYERVWLDAIQFYQIARDINASGECFVQLYCVDTKPGENKFLFELPEQDFDDDATAMWKPGHYLDLERKRPIMVADIVESTNKKGEKFKAERNRTAFTLSEFLRLRPHKITGRMTVEKLGDTVEKKEAKTSANNSDTLVNSADDVADFIAQVVGFVNGDVEASRSVYLELDRSDTFVSDLWQMHNFCRTVFNKIEYRKRAVALEKAAEQKEEEETKQKTGTNN